MPEKDLDTLFNEAFEKASRMTEQLPPDIMLRIYAYYKQATAGVETPDSQQSINLRDAFKMNAWMQIRHISRDEAKRLYIETINSIT